MPESKPFVSLYSTLHDVGIFGAGYAGYAAAVRLAKEGKKVFLADPSGGLLWESGRAFFPEPGPGSEGFDYFAQIVARISGVAEAWIDGGTAEFTANELLRDTGVPLLYYVSPVAVERNGEMISAVIVATKSGLRRLVARQWMDATESGTLARVAGLARAPRLPERLVARLMFQKRQWQSGPGLIRSRSCPGCRLSWQESGWSAERALQIEMPGAEGRFLRLFAPALAALRAERGRELDESYVSHASFEPFPVYSGGSAASSPAANLALAVPGYAREPSGTLGERYALGHTAAGELAGLPECGKGRITTRPIRLTAPVRPPRRADVAVAGLGTGGALAALAAARAGSRVSAFDLLSFSGGVGAGGGIPEYYWGSTGGLQAEVDERVRGLMPLFGGRDCWPRGFHPDAKRVALEALLHEAGVHVQYGTLLAGVGKQGRRVTGAWLAGPAGLQRLKADAWIDATGDGDLCAGAGAKSRFGRSGDQLPQACTQSCGHFMLQNGLVVGRIVNMDTGIVDPMDSEDATRARSEGLHALVQPVLNAFNRVTHAAPMLGVRQGRQVETDYRLTLDDLVERRRFPDAVGYTGSHYDNHAADYEFESDDAFFYVNCAGLWHMRTACEIPYRMLLPKGLDNVWIACRAAGVTEEAVHSFRMQRDIQRIGEICGVAAALAGRRVESRGVSYSALKARLEASGAIPVKDPVGSDFGKSVGPADFTALPSSHPGIALWMLYRNEGLVRDPRWNRLLKSKDSHESWRAALLLGARGQGSAEPRLIKAIEDREVGPDAVPERLDHQRGSRFILPRWWIAVTLLRRCGTSRCLPNLIRLAGQAGHPLRLKTALALTLAALSDKPGRSSNKQAVGAALDHMESATTDLTGAGWPMAYAAAKARAAWGLSHGDSLRILCSDSRATVRRAFQELA